MRRATSRRIYTACQKCTARSGKTVKKKCETGSPTADVDWDVDEVDWDVDEVDWDVDEVEWDVEIIGQPWRMGDPA